MKKLLALYGSWIAGALCACGALYAFSVYMSRQYQSQGPDGPQKPAEGPTEVSPTPTAAGSTGTRPRTPES